VPGLFLSPAGVKPQAESRSSEQAMQENRNTACRVRLGALWLALPPLLLPVACTTTIVDSENPSKNRPPQWTDYWTLPVEIHGSIPGVSAPQLEAVFPAGAGSALRIVLYLNPARMPPDSTLCDNGGDFIAGHQPGRYAFMVGALCNGTAVITYATANILAGGITPQQIAGHLEMMRLQLYQALTPGNNHPERLHAGQMYGP
jgi:hypothetical protein